MLNPGGWVGHREITCVIAFSKKSLSSPPLRQQRLDLIISILKTHQVKSAVDLGCGEGRLLEALLVAGGLARVVGVDHSDARVRSAERRLGNACKHGQTAETIVADILTPDERWSGSGCPH